MFEEIARFTSSFRFTAQTASKQIPAEDLP
jgi:hypothetical protein